MISCISTFTVRDNIENEVIRDKVTLSLGKEKMRETKLKWFGNIIRWTSDAPRRRCEKIILSDVRRMRDKGRFKKNWEKVVQQNLAQLLLTKNMTFDKRLWMFNIGMEDREPEIVPQRVVIQNYRGEKLVGILHETGSKEIIIICHGAKSSKDCIPVVSVAVGLENMGISPVRFDFPGIGESEGGGLSIGFGNLRRETEDLRAVIQRFRVINTIIGHSKGGSVVVLSASIYHDICSLINISGFSDLRKAFEGYVGKNFLERLKRDGFIDVNNRRGEFQHRFTEEGLKDDLDTDIRAACQLIHDNCRVLTVHGSMDQLVSVTEALDLHKLMPKPSHVLRIVEGADHWFSFHQNELVSIVVDFLRGNADFDG